MKETMGAIRLLLLVALVSLAAYGPAAAQTKDFGVDPSNFDTNVRPQDDFYRFVNGGWLKTATIPADRPMTGSFVDLADSSEAAVRTILDEVSSSSAPAGSVERKVGDFYRSFMDSARVEALGLSPLQSELDRIGAVNDKGELPGQFAHLASVGVSSPLGMFVFQDQKQSDRYIAYVNQSGLGMPDRDYYFKEGERFDQVRAAYAKYIAQLLEMAGNPNPEKAAADVVAFETTLAEKQWTNVQNRDREATYNKMSVSDLEAMTPRFDWSAYVAAVGAESSPAIVVRQPSYVEALGPILQETPLETLKNYMTFKLIDAYAYDLSSNFVDARFDFRGRTLVGQQQDRPRWKRGVSTVEGALGEAVGKIYVDRHFSPESKARMEELVANLTATYREAIDNLDWMSPETKAEAQRKLANFRVKIGYPNKWRDYTALEIAPDDLVGNEMRSAKFQHDDNVGRLGKPIDREEWGMTPQTVNAYYNSVMNEIVFPAAILQPPFFNASADDAVNYGGIGAVIGHEISHGFDDQGRRSDGEGNLRDWWTEADASAFQSRADKLIERYNDFSPVEGMNVNGALTIGENIGDLSGIAVAYKAYKRSLNGKEAPVINGYTGDQRFFLGYGQIWRSLLSEDLQRQRLLSDPHSPPEYRVNGILPNISAFYEAFDVKEGDKMYLPPEERVQIW